MGTETVVLIIKELKFVLRTQILLVVQLKMECGISGFVEFH